MDISAEKAKLRIYFRDLRKNSDPADTKIRDKILCEKLFSLPEYSRAEIILMYFPSKGEPNILPVFEKSLSDGKTVAFPLCVGKEIVFKAVKNLDGLTTSYFGIPAPSPDAKDVPTNKNTLCVLPALAFDKAGFRLGYGGGFYDRFLADFGGVSAGLVRSEFLTKSLPHDNFDKKADIIITENEVIVTNAKEKLV